jgi:HD-GYP domain-containing protein (c-di-GMP phosphodiesterase class II)/HAMP domain-containing protein
MVISLRARILLIVFLILLPILGLVYVNVRQEERIWADLALVQARKLAGRVSGDYADLVRDTQRLLASLARLPEIRTADSGCSPVLAWYHETYPAYTNLGLIDRRGNLVCSALPSPPVYLGDRAYFRHAVETRRFAVGEYQIGRITHQPGVNFGYPVLDSTGDVRAVVYAALNLGRLGLVGADTVLPGGSIVTLVDREGTVLTRFPEPDRWKGRPLPETAVLNAMRTQDQGVVETQSPDGIHRVYGFASLGGNAASAALRVSIGIPTAPVFAEHRELVTQNAAGLIVLGLVGLTAAWLAFGTLLIRPIEALVTAAQHLERGDLSARSKVPHHQGELGQLGRAFDQMAGEIERREIERNRAEQQILRQLQTLTSLYAGARQLTLSLDPDDLTRRIVHTFVDVLGARAAWIGRTLPDGRVRSLIHYPPDAILPTDVEVRWDESPQGQGPSGRAIRSGFPVVVSDVVGDAHMALWRDTLLRQGLASLAAFPMTSRDRTFGVIEVMSDDAEFFSPERVEIFAAFAHQAGAALENARLHAETEDRLEQLEALSKIDLAITSGLDLKMTLRVILDQVTTRLRVDAADVLVLHPHAQVLEFAAGRGFQEMSGIAQTRLRLGQDFAGRVALERRTISIPNLQEAEAAGPRAPGTPVEYFVSYLLDREHFVSYAAAPLVAKGRVLGVLEVFHRTRVESDPTWLSFLEAMAGQAAIAVDNATLFDELQQSNLELARAYDTTLEGWSRALDLRDKETEGHTERVTDLTVRLARAMGMSEDQLVHVRRGALLHDIGKMGVPDAILFKPGPLTDEEWKHMRQHPAHARDLLRPIAYLRPALAIPYAHHEKWDGTGYPEGLRGEQIPLEARIFAVVDVWDAVTSDRPYRPAWSKGQALNNIREQTGRHFDPRVAEEFVKLVGTETA